MLANNRVGLCRQDDLAEGQCRAFTVEKDLRETQDIFLLRHRDRIYAYQNRCPHTGVNLNWLPDQFLDIDGTFIQCSVHGALFRIDDGFCVRGPCAGQSLQPVKLEISDGQIYLGD
jgi:nitrite reductase/ring-hydroxylating ferredoxin subunit